MVDEMNGGKNLYVFMRVTDPNTQLPKNVLVNWVHKASSVMCGMTMFGSVLSVCWFSCPLTTRQGLGESKCKHDPFTCVRLPQQGEGVPPSRKGVCARHTHDVATFFRVSSASVSWCDCDPLCHLAGSPCHHQCQVRDGSGGGLYSRQGGQGLRRQLQLPQGEGQTNA